MYNDYYTPTKVEQLELTKARWNEAKRKTEDAKYIEDLIFRDYVEKLSGYMSKWDYLITSIHTAIDEIGKKKKNERKNLTFIEESIYEDFFKNDEGFRIKIVEITHYGLEDSGHTIEFYTYPDDNIIYSLFIPNRRTINVHNYDSFYDGKFVFSEKVGEYSWNVICKDYDADKLADKILTYFDEKAKEEMNV